MEAFEIMNEYLKREMSASELDRASREARRLIVKVKTAAGKDMREKARNAGISYEEFMNAQRLVSKKVS